MCINIMRSKPSFLFLSFPSRICSLENLIQAFLATISNYCIKAHRGWPNTMHTPAEDRGQALQQESAVAVLPLQVRKKGQKVTALRVYNMRCTIGKCTIGKCTICSIHSYTRVMGNLILVLLKRMFVQNGSRMGHTTSRP